MTRLCLLGATGDLVKTKIRPALLAIAVTDTVSYGRRKSDVAGYIRGELSEIPAKLAHQGITHVYVALPPAQFAEALEGLASLDCKVALEKPFGSSRADAEALLAEIQRLGMTERVYLVDHYLGKKVVRDTAGLYSPDLREIEIEFMESADVSTRGAFYDKVGAIRDVMQNHCLAVLASLLRPESCTDSLTVCRQEVMKQLHYIPGSLKRGRYEGYRETPGVAPDSTTETYAECELSYKQVKVKMRAGKAQSASRVALCTDGICVEIDKVYNSYEAILSDFLSPVWTLSLSFEEALASWRITEEILSDVSRAPVYTYPPGSAILFP